MAATSNFRSSISNFHQLHFHNHPHHSVVPQFCPSHVVGHVNGVQLIRQETVPEVHPLFLASGIDGNNSRIHYHHHTHNQVMFLQDHIGNQRNQIQSLLLTATQLHHHHQQVGPGEHGTEMGKTTQNPVIATKIQSLQFFILRWRFPPALGCISNLTPT